MGDSGLSGRRAAHDVSNERRHYRRHQHHLVVLILQNDHLFDLKGIARGTIAVSSDRHSETGQQPFQQSPPRTPEEYVAGAFLLMAMWSGLRLKIW